MRRLKMWETMHASFKSPLGRLGGRDSVPETSWAGSHSPLTCRKESDIFLSKHVPWNTLVMTLSLYRHRGNGLKCDQYEEEQEKFPCKRRKMGEDVGGVREGGKWEMQKFFTSVPSGWSRQRAGCHWLQKRLVKKFQIRFVIFVTFSPRV